MLRKALSPITLADGTYIPRGAVISSLTTPMHLDPSVYGLDAEKFDGFRWSRMREEGKEDGEGTKHQAVGLKPEYQIFGLGKHAW
jgi:cytochrome P450